MGRLLRMKSFSDYRIINFLQAPFLKILRTGACLVFLYFPAIFGIDASFCLQASAFAGHPSATAPLQGPQLPPGTSSLEQEQDAKEVSTEEDALPATEDEAIILPERSGGAAHTQDTSHPPALLEVYNYPVAIFRGSLYGYTPADRERAQEARIDRYLEEDYEGVITTERRAEGIMIFIDGKRALMVLPEDVDPFSDQTLEEYVEEITKALAIALKAAKEQSSTPYLLRAAGLTLLATLVYGLLIWGVQYLQGRAYPHLRRIEHNFIKKMRTRGLHMLVTLGSLTFWFMRVVFWGLLALLAFKWLSFCLQQFPYTRHWGDQLDENFLAFLGEAAEAIVATLPDLLIIIVIVLITRGVVWMAQAFFSGVESGRVHLTWMDQESARATKRIIMVIIWLFALVMIFPYLPGSDSEAFKGVSIFVGLLVSLGSASVVSQFTSGLVLMYSHALKPGEYVQIGEHEGTVGALGFLSTKIHTKKNEEVHVPNTVILGTTIKNYTRLAKSTGVLLYTSITIGYDTPWRQIHAMLIDASQRTSGLLNHPSPFVHQTSLSDFYVEYQLNAYIEMPEDRLKVLAELHAHIQDVFHEQGIQIMSPHYMMDPPNPVVVKPEDWHASPTPPSHRPPSPGSTS